MPEKPIQTVKLMDVIDACKKFLLYLIQSTRLFTVIILSAIVLSIGYYFLQKPSYEANLSFILEEKSGGMSGGLSGIASQFGIDIGSLTGGSSGLFAGDNILDILKSRLIIEKVLLSKADSSKGADGQTLADVFLRFSGLKDKWHNKRQELAAVSFQKLAAGAPHSLVQDSVLYVIYDRITKKHLSTERLNKKGSIITVNTVSTDPLFSKCFTERIVEETKKLYINIKTGISSANVQRLQNRADSLMAVINSKSYQSATLQILDANTAFKANAVPAEASQRDKMVAYAIYTEVIKNLEASRMTLAGQTPIIQILDAPKYPLNDQKKSLFLLLFIGAIAGFVISLAIAFYLYPSSDR